MTREQIIQEAHRGNEIFAEATSPGGAELAAGEQFAKDHFARYPAATIEDFEKIAIIGQMLNKILDYKKEE